MMMAVDVQTVLLTLHEETPENMMNASKRLEWAGKGLDIGVL
jgi:hypothetical protein